MVEKAQALVLLGHIRSHGCRDLLIYWQAIGCNHSTIMNAHHLPADLAIRSLGPRMVCARCGHRGADVRPDSSPMSEQAAHVRQKRTWVVH